MKKIYEKGKPVKIVEDEKPADKPKKTDGKKEKPADK
jgi:hypothetical protein